MFIGGKVSGYGKGIPITVHESSRGCGCKRPHIDYIATALGRGDFYARPPFPPGKVPVPILLEAERTQGAVWTRKSEENLQSSDKRGSNPTSP